MNRNRIWSQLIAVIYAYSFIKTMFCVSGKTSVIKCDIFPPGELYSNDKCGLGLIEFVIYNWIRNIEKGINKVLNFDNDKKNRITYSPYKISDIATYIKEYLRNKNINVITKEIINLIN